MKISNETKVGILAIVALTLLILGFNFLKGKNIFKNQKQLYAVFSNLGSLEKSNEVKINGLPVGNVYDYKEIDKNLSGIIVVINLKRDVNIPVNSVATIESELLGTTYINIRRGDAAQYLEDNDTINTDPSSSLFTDVKQQINPTLGKLREAIDSLKMVLSDINNFFKRDEKNISDMVTHLKNASHSLTILLNPHSGPLANTLGNASSFSENLKKNNDSITAAISGIRRLSEKFTAVEIQPTIDSLQEAVGELKTAIARINSNNGTLGLLMNDRKLYDKLNDAVLSAEILLDDLRANPKRYVNISVFGRKDKDGPLISPSKKDTLP